MKKPISLQDFIPKVSPRFTAPTHLRPLTDLFERVAKGEEVLACLACSPRHGKTDTIWHGIAWLLRLRPEMRIAYVSYSQTLSEKKSRRGRMIAERARVKLDPSAASLHDWRTLTDEGGVWVTSIGGPITGEGFDLVVIDDPVKSRAEAESSLMRDRAHEYVIETLIARGEPGCSFINIMHRWHVDDLSARLIADGWQEITLPAIDDEGRALWPERFSVERLRAIEARVGKYTWASLYQGQPISRGGAVFSGGTVFYDRLPEKYRVVVGVDLAYTAKSRADYSVAVVLALAPDETFYVLEVVRRQVAAPDFAAVLAGIQARYPGASFASYIAGTEKGSIDFMARAGIPITPLAAREDKFSRSQMTAAAWNAGRILLPREAPWLDAFVGEIISFVGTGDRNDDQVDALVSAHDAKAGKVHAAKMIAALRSFDYAAQARALGVRDMRDLYSPDEIARLKGWIP